MRVSWQWLSELIDLSSVGTPEKLAEILTARGIEVEEVRALAKGLEKVVTAQILERNPHPQADRLSLCKVSLGAGAPLEIVCGAQNMKAGDKVALAQIGAHLPNGLKIEQSKIRGVVSNGMLCSEEELCFKEKAEGILILPTSAPLGKPLAEVLGKNDTILTLKLTANRGDCLSHYGLAREIGAAIGKKPKKPAATLLAFKGDSPITTKLDVGDACSQFYGAFIEGVKIGPSPDWLVRRLEAVGSRSINNVVDATNYVMLEIGHPMHAYDADRLKGKTIRARIAKNGEEVPLLDGTSVKLHGTEIVIADDERAVGLAGVMGGGNSEVQDGSKRLFLECAEFSPVLVRRASSKHQKKTDAAHRFERGVDPAGLPLAISRLAQLITELAGGKIVGSTVAAAPSRDPKKVFAGQLIQVSADYFNAFLGTSLKTDEIEKIFTGLECGVKKDGPKWIVTPPSYRLDLNLKEDLAEEAARTIGYDRIPSRVPALTSAPTALSTEPAMMNAALIESAKDALRGAGLEETINYAFTSRKWLEQFGLKSSVLVMNPLSEEHEALVPSLIPGLVQNALTNWNHHFGSEALAIRLFELRPTFHSMGTIAAKGEGETGVEERWKLAFVMSGPRYAEALRNELGEVDFSDLKAAAETLFSSLGTKGVRLIPMSASREPSALVHPGQAVEVLAGNASAGFFGLLHPRLGSGLKARAPLWIAELDWTAISKLSRPVTQRPKFQAWSDFPPMERDFALLVKPDISADKITQVALKAGKPLAKVAKVFDIYRGSQVAQGMTSVAVRVIFYEEGRSLQEPETEAASTRILDAWKKELGAELRS